MRELNDAEKKFLSELFDEYDGIIRKVCAAKYRRYDDYFMYTMVNNVFQIFIRKTKSTDRDVYLNHQMHLFRKRYYFYIKEAYRMFLASENDYGGITDIPKDKSVYFKEIHLHDQYKKVAARFQSDEEVDLDIKGDRWDIFYDILLYCLDLWQKKNRGKKNTKRDYKFFVDFYIRRLNKSQIYKNQSSISERMVGRIINQNLDYMQKCIQTESVARYDHNILEGLL